MARGWESKSVEDQVAAAADERAKHVTRTPSPEDRERESRRAGLRLARAKTLADLEKASNRAHRALLERTLAHLDAEIDALNAKP